MCGIVACLALDGASWDATNIEKSLLNGLKKIEHRGPDGAGIWFDPNNRCGLGHCRLSINDLSPAGAQPLHSASGHLHAIVNGEIYDDGSLRDSLSTSYQFVSKSDSELVLALYHKYGIAFINHLRGEFALILYDSSRDIAIAARDRYGIKPLFWRRDEEQLWFAAEIKAFLDTSGWEPEWDVGAIVDGGWGQDTRTLFKGVQKLRPAHYMISEGGREPEIRSYWDITYPVKYNLDTRTEEEIISSLRSHLLDSVRLRLRADVPIGIYLSGGIDSSALAGIANHLVREGGLKMGSQDPKERICCFSIGFDEISGFDESDVSRRTAEWLDVKYVKSHMSESTLVECFEDATYHIEHHNHDLNYVGKYALSKVPRENGYKVVLTGEGADEQLGGYPLFLPDFLRENDLYTKDQVSAEERSELVEKQERITKSSYDLIGADSSYFERKHSQSRLGQLSTPCSLSAFTPPSQLFRSIDHPSSPLTTVYNNITPQVQDMIESVWHPLNSALYVWTKGHLANQFLSCLGDRVEMSHSVEARTPFLDHVLTEYINHIPPALKIRSQRVDQSAANEVVYVEKYALREAVKPFVTDEVYRRKKHPYTAPSTYTRNGPVYQLLHRLVTKANVDKLGFVSFSYALELLNMAFEEESDPSKRTWAWRQCLMVAQWIVLGQRFHIKPARLSGE